MSDTAKTKGLDAARARLEAALSALTQGVVSAQGTLSASAEVMREKDALTERLVALEAENLKLHEQVAVYALQPNAQALEARYETLQEEYAATNSNYRMLKQQYAALQDAMEARSSAEAGTDSTGQNASQAETVRLNSLLAALSAEKDTMRAELDKAIAELETVLEEA